MISVVPICISMHAETYVVKNGGHAHLLKRQPWLTALTCGAPSDVDVGTIRAIDMSAVTTSNLVNGLEVIRSRLTRAPDNDLPVHVHKSRLRRSFVLARHSNDPIIVR